MATQGRADRTSRCRIPQADRAIGACGRHQPLARTTAQHRHGMNGRLMPAKQAGETTPCCDVPHSDSALGAAGHQHATAIGQARSRHRMDRAPMTGELRSRPEPRTPPRGAEPSHCRRRQPVGRPSPSAPSRWPGLSSAHRLGPAPTRADPRATGGPSRPPLRSRAASGRHRARRTPRQAPSRDARPAPSGRTPAQRFCRTGAPARPRRPRRPGRSPLTSGRALWSEPSRHPEPAGRHGTKAGVSVEIQQFDRAVILRDRQQCPTVVDGHCIGEMTRAASRGIRLRLPPVTGSQNRTIPVVADRDEPGSPVGLRERGQGLCPMLAAQTTLPGAAGQR